MTQRLRCAVLLCLTGCSPGLVGDEWAGTCGMGSGRDSWELPVGIEFVRDIYGELLGTGWYEYDGHRFKGEVEGTIEDDDLGFSLPGVFGGYTVTLMVSADLEDDDLIEGDCDFLEFSGELVLTR